MTGTQTQGTNSPFNGASTIYMSLDYCDIDLRDLIKSPIANVTDQHIRSYMQQLLNGMNYMHSHKVLHRDIKPANILITKDNVIKIADWGLARNYYNEQKLTNRNRMVTLWYRPPELLLGHRYYDGKVDIWSVGCLFAEIKNKGRPILTGKDEKNQLELEYMMFGSPTGETEEKFKTYPNYEDMKIETTFSRRVHKVYSNFDEYSLELLERLMELDPSKRHSASEALTNDYFHKDPVTKQPSPVPHHNELPKFNMETIRYEKKQSERNREDAAKQAREKAIEREKAIDANQSRGPGGAVNGQRGVGYSYGKSTAVVQPKFSIKKRDNSHIQGPEIAVNEYKQKTPKIKNEMKE